MRTENPDKKGSRWLIVLLAGMMVSSAASQEIPGNPSEVVIVEGLIIPRDDDGMYIRNPDGQFEVEWTEKTGVALEVDTRIFPGLKGDLLRYPVFASDQVIDFPLPKGPITGIVKVRKGRLLKMALQEAKEEKWIPGFGLILRFGEKLPGQLPTADDPRFVGIWDPAANPRTLTIEGTKYEVSLKKGGKTTALLFNVIGVRDCRPFVSRARVVGHRKGEVIVADEIHVTPLGDQVARDDPGLPRYLFIGDSISGNYGRGLREALAGRFNLHHPPTNCGSTKKGRASIVEWLGGYDREGRQWDVISFNFGHWDAGNLKATYQENLEAIITELKKTGAKLIWVTTCPVPHGYPPTGGLTKEGRAPRQTSGVMEKYLNPWALEVIRRHPGISICDQWRYVKENEETLFKTFWARRNVHFSRKEGDKLGHFLAEHVHRVTKRR